MSVETLKLKKTLLINGISRNELTYDIEELTVEELAKAESYKVKLSGSGLFNSTYAIADYLLHVCLGMQAVIVINKDITEDDLKRLRPADINKLAAVGARFFTDTEESEPNTSEKQQEVMQENSTAPLKTVTTPL